MSKKTNDMWDITERMMQGQFAAKDAEGSEVKNSTGVVKCKKCGSQLWSLRSGEYYCTKCGAKMDAPLSKDDVPQKRLQNVSIRLNNEELHRGGTNVPAPAKYRGGAAGLRKAVEAFGKNQRICVTENWPDWFTGKVVHLWTHPEELKNAHYGKDAKDADSLNDLKYKLRNKLMGAQASEKSLANLLSSNGFSKIQKLSGYSFKGENSRGLKMGITYKPIDPDNKTFKVKEVWFEDADPIRESAANVTQILKEYQELNKRKPDGNGFVFYPNGQKATMSEHEAKVKALLKRYQEEVAKQRKLGVKGYAAPAKDADMSFKLSNGESGTAKIVASAPAGYTYTNRTFNGYKIYKNGFNYVAVALHFDKPTYEGLANYMNGDAMMNGANYRPALDAALTKDAAADGRETWKWDTMFMDLAEKVYNKLQMAGITSNVRKNGQYYHIEAKVTPDERKKIEFFIKGHTIHSVGGYKSMSYPDSSANDEAAKKTHTWLTMFVSLAEKVKNYCNVNLGIKCDVSKPGSYYKLIITGTPEELRKVESFINRNTIHEQR